MFTTGVLDCFLDRGVYFRYGVGVSAGACNGLSYMSRQRGRARRTNIDLLEKYRFIGMKHLWTQRSILDLDTVYNKIPNEILPFDYDTYFANEATFEMVTTNCLTGRAAYLTETADRHRLVEIARASSSLPFVCPIVPIDGVPMLDGGIIDSIPVKRAIATGHGHNVVVLTRNKGYRERETDRKIPRFIYSRYPRLRVLLSHRVACYNAQLDLIDRLEEQGRILAIRPIHPVEVTRLESNTDKLNRLYEEGYACAEAALARADIRL